MDFSWGIVEAGTIRWDIVRRLLPTALPAAFTGALLLRALGDGEALQSRVKMTP